jgi:hypothetical protein
MCEDCAGTGKQARWPGDGGKHSRGPFSGTIVAIRRPEAFNRPLIRIRLPNGTEGEGHVNDEGPVLTAFNELMESNPIESLYASIELDPAERYQMYRICGMGRLPYYGQDKLVDCYTCWGFGCRRSLRNDRTSQLDLEIARMVIEIQPKSRHLLIPELLQRPLPNEQHYLKFLPTLDWLLGTEGVQLPKGVRNNPDFKREGIQRRSTVSR